MIDLTRQACPVEAVLASLFLIHAGRTVDDFSPTLLSRRMGTEAGPGLSLTADRYMIFFYAKLSSPVFDRGRFILERLFH
jgi:hypothetical protein